jgi:hypothetical protein
MICCAQRSQEALLCIGRLGPYKLLPLLSNLLWTNCFVFCSAWLVLGYTVTG